MKKKIKEYIDLIFAEAPECAKTREMKEEMYANVSERYDDLINEGKSEGVAYNICISGIGDISELIEEIKREQGEYGKAEQTVPTESQKVERVFTAEEKAEIEKYRVRRGVMNSVAISLYILCWLPLVLLSSLAEALGGNADVISIIGLAVMMVMIAVATVLMIMKSSIKPVCLKGVKASEYTESEEVESRSDKKTVKRRNPVLRALGGALWGSAIVAFLLFGTFLGAWHPAWMLFLIATALDNVIEAIFELAGKKYV